MGLQGCGTGRIWPESYHRFYRADGALRLGVQFKNTEERAGRSNDTEEGRWNGQPLGTSETLRRFRIGSDIARS